MGNTYNRYMQQEIQPLPVSTSLKERMSLLGINLAVSLVLGIAFLQYFGVE
jgi:hypothetical protein